MKRNLSPVFIPWNAMKQRLESAGRWIVRDNPAIQSFVTHKWTIVFMAAGFLLGRAMILEQLTPFALAFFAVVYYLRRDSLYAVGLSLLAGSVFSMHQNTVWILAGMGAFLLVQKALDRFERAELSLAPMTVFAITFIMRLFTLMMFDQMHWYPLVLAAVEAVLGFVLTLIFIQAIPVFTMTRKSVQLKNEELICVMILLASMMTGTVGWIWSGISVEHVMSRYFILVFAFVGGAPLGASVGVVTGLILSLASVASIYQIGLLAFAGLLAGLLREGKKTGVALGLLIGSSILSLYALEQPQVVASVLESLAAIGLLFLTPRSSIQALAKYIPGTLENAKSQHDYAKRVRDVTAGRVEQFSEVFRQLSHSFVNLTSAEATAHKQEDELGHFMNSVAERTCVTCWKRGKCWDEQFYTTYRWMTDMMSSIEENPALSKRELKPEWTSACVKTEQVLQTMRRQYELYKHNLHWKRQIQESRQLVAEQLSGVSQVMEDLAREIKREGQMLHDQEEHIRRALDELGLSILHIDIISLDEGNVEIEMVHSYHKGFDECRKIIAPLLSDILGENITVKKEIPDHPGKTANCTVLFGSAKEYEVETGIAGAAKGGELLSGDTFSTMELGNGKFAVALSDGMGNGERASAESRTTLGILQQLLQSGMDEKLAVKSVNSILLLRSPDEMFATLDVALIDQYTAKTTFLKIGSTPSFIKRGDEVIIITANNLPVGILQDIEVELVSVQLQPGDTLIMMTDGLLDAPGHAVNKELWMKRIIQELKTDTPQDIADCLLETAVRYHHGDIMDDMTVVVARVEQYKPEWATFRWNGLQRIERPKTVS